MEPDAVEAVGEEVDGDNLAGPDPAKVLAIVRPTLRHEPLGDVGSDRYGDVLGSGGSPKMIS